VDQQESAGPGRVPSRRRDFIAMLGCPALVWPLLARAQPINKLARIGLFLVGDATANMTGPEPKNRYVNSLLNGLRERGYVYGRDFVTEPRGGEGVPARFPILAAEL
jgi:putative ABC transport system substrate-binding protein